MLALTWQSLAARRRRVASTALATMLGVAFLVGTLVLGDTLAANFDDLFSDTAAGTDVVVRAESPLDDSFDADAGRRPIDAALLDTVAAVDGVDTVEGTVVGYGQLLGADGDPIGGNGPPRLAGSWITTPELNPYELVEGRAPREPDEVVINRGAAESGDLAVGDRTVVQLPAPVEVSVVGIATFGGADGMGETTWTAFTLDAARSLLLREPQTISSILVTAADGTDSGELAAAVDDVLPDGVEALTGDQLVDERLERLDFLGTIRGALVGFALVAVLVASISINNAFAITIAQRTRELALLRAVGASRRQIRRMVTLEALIVGVTASIAGLGLGLVVATALKGVFAGFGFSLPIGGLTVDRSAIVVGLVVGIGSTLWAARGPARRAAKVAPVAALRTANLEGRPAGPRPLAAGIALGVASSAVAATGAGTAPGLVAVGGLGLLATAFVLAPVLLPRFARAIGALARPLARVQGDLSVGNTNREPRRAARAATSLMVGATVATLFTVVAVSAARDTEADVAAGFGRADLSIASPVFGGGVLGSDLVPELERRPEVDQVAGVARATVAVDGDETQVTVTDLSRAAEVLDLRTVDGGLAGLGPDHVVIDESRAEAEGWAVGDTVEITYLDGAVTDATVAAVIADTAVLSGVVLPTDAWFPHTGQPGYSAVFMTTADGVDTGTARAAIADLARRYSGDVQDRTEFAEAAAAGLDMLLGLIYVLLALAIVISLLGIANSLSMAVHERRRELGVLRALGLTRRQARSVIRWESGIVAAFGTLLGLVLGAVVGSLLFVAITDDAAPALPVGRLAVIGAAGLAVGVLAARRPARHAADLDVLDAIATT